MLQAVQPALNVADFKGDSNALCKDFFESYATELPAPLDDQLRQISVALFANHMRSRLGGLFKLLAGDAEETIGSVTSVSAARGWRLAIQEQAGMTFAAARVPESAVVFKAVTGNDEVPTKLLARDKRIEQGATTVADDMECAGDLPDEPIGEECFSVFTNDVAKQEADKDELAAFVEMILTQFASSHGKINLGAPLLRKIHAQAHRRIKFLPKRGKTQGKDRSIGSMVSNLAVNRGHVRLCI